MVSFLANPIVRVILQVGAAAVVAVAAYVLDRAFERSRLYARYEAKIRPWRDLASPAVAVPVGLFLLWAAWRGVLLVQPFDLLALGWIGAVLRGVQAAIGFLILVGLFMSAAAVGLMALVVGALALFGTDALPVLHLGGAAAFLYRFSRGRFSWDWFLGKPIASTPQQRKQSYLALRILTGLAMISAAVLEWITQSPATSHGAWALGLTIAAGLSFLTGFITRLSALIFLPVVLWAAGTSLWGEPAAVVPVLGILTAFLIFGDKYHKGEVAK